MKTYQIPEDVLVGILNYLATKPYGEVAVGVTSLQKLIHEQGGTTAQPTAPNEAPTQVAEDTSTI